LAKIQKIPETPKESQEICVVFDQLLP